MKRNSNQSLLTPQMLMGGLGFSVALALAISFITPGQSFNINTLKNIDNSLAALSPSLATSSAVPTSIATASPTPRSTTIPSSPAPGTLVNVAPVADARVKRTEPTQNYGASDQLITERDATGSYFESYLRFNLSFIPSGATVKSATLNLYTIDDSINGPELYRVTNTYKNSTTVWTETGLNWNNKPAKVGSSLGNKGSVPMNVWVTYDITALVNSYKGSIPYTFGLFPDSTHSLIFASKENGINGRIPYISVQF